MNLQRVFRETAVYLCVFLSLFVFSLAPLLVNAQETGSNTQTSGSGRSFIDVVGTTVGSFLNNPVTTTGNLIQSGLNGTGNVITNVISGIDTFVQHPVATTGTVIRSGLNTIGTTVNNVISGAVAFVEHPIVTTGSVINNVVNSAIDTYVELGNSVDWLEGNSWRIGDGSNGTESGTNAIGEEGPVDLTPSGGNSNARPGDATGGGSGARPTASRGSVSNPFSTGDSDTTGANSDDIGTNNVETQTNPYLFEYDPNSTNNNPSGSGAQTQ